MRIHRLQISNFRGVDECAVTFPTDGVTIIEGPNEIGKTTLSEAIDLLMYERDDSTKRTVKSVQPVGKDVGAEAEIEMTSGPYHFIYRKRWHRHKMTELTILQPQRGQFAGREAHDKVRSMLEETLDRPLWEALRLRQGTQLEQAVLVGDSLGRALDLAAGGDTEDQRGDDIWIRVTSERDKYWTATGLAKSERTVLATKVASEGTRVVEIERVLKELQGDADAVEALQGDAKELVEKQKEQKDLERNLRTKFDAIEHQRIDVERLKGAYDTAQAERDRAQEISKGRIDLVTRVAAAVKAMADQESRVTRTAPALSSAETLLQEAQGATVIARGKASAAEAAYRRAIADETYRRHEIELAQLSERLERVQEAIRRSTEAETILEVNKVNDEMVDRIREAYLELVRTEAAASAGASNIDMHALVDVTITAEGKSVALTAGEQHHLVVADSAELEVPNVIRIVITAGDEAKSMAFRLTDAQASFKEVCAEAGVEDVAGAQIAANDRKEALRVLASADKDIKQDLRDLTTETLDQKIQRIASSISNYEKDRPSAPSLPDDLDEAHRIAGKCDEELQLLREDLIRFETYESKSSESLQTLRLDDAGTKANLGQARALKVRETASLTATREELSDHAIANQLTKSESDLLRCTDALMQAKDNLKAQNPEIVETRLQNARDVLTRVTDELYENDIRVRELRTKLAVKGDEGLGQQLDDSKSMLAHLSRERDRLEVHALAAKVLYDSFAARRADTLRRYVAPFRERIETLARIVFNPSLEVELDTELRISRRTLDGVTLDFVDLSTGAKEQLAMISRLACASIVAADGAPVIFDDALGWSDPRKLDSMGAVISAAGQSCQIIIMTCTPGRYASVGKAKVVKLPV